MNQLSALAQKDARIVYRDRFMLFIALYALVIAIACRLIVPWLPVAQLDFYLAPAVVLTGPFLLGTLPPGGVGQLRPGGVQLVVFSEQVFAENRLLTSVNTLVSVKERAACSDAPSRGHQRAKVQGTPPPSTKVGNPANRRP